MDYRKNRKQNEKARLCKSIITSALAFSSLCIAAYTIHASAYMEKSVAQVNDTYTDSSRLIGIVPLYDEDDEPVSDSNLVNTTSTSSYSELSFSSGEDATIAKETEDNIVDTEPLSDEEDIDPLSYTYMLDDSQNVSQDVSQNVAPVSTKTQVSTDTTGMQTEYTFENLYLDIADVRKPSNMTLEQLQKWTKRFAPNWVGLEPAILEYDKQVNLVFLLAVARAETGAGTTDGMVGAYNCFNIIGKGGNYISYNSYLESIADFVSLLTSAYLSPNGIYFNGYGICDIGVMYAGPHWGPGIITLADELIWHFDKGSLSD